jgi:ABC-type nitrate/sulfonate/bicarbonate transport system ATPase subunit
MAAGVALSLSGGQKSYARAGRRHDVFGALDLELRQDELLALLGPSGCGKSTLLRTLAGLEPLDGGRLEVSGGWVGAPAGHSVGICFQEPSLLPWLTVAQNVALGLRFAANSAARERASVARTLDELGLSEVADSYPAQLSGGQAQRANVARVVITGRPILLLDEPFAALDPLTRAALQDWLLRLRDSRGLSLIVVTHDLSEALRLGDRVALMNGNPGCIRRTWQLRRSGEGGPAPADQDREGALRAEILQHYSHSTEGIAR